MKTYIGTKMIRAQAMTRAEYNVFRGWTLPANENGADDGYLVEYLDGGKPNVDTHAGYVSWSPEDVFVAAYREYKENDEIGAAMAVLKAAIKADPDYAWGWHCNIAMAAFDAGCPHGAANEGAARVLQMLFGIDTRENKAFDPIWRIAS